MITFVDMTSKTIRGPRGFHRGVGGVTLPESQQADRMKATLVSQISFPSEVSLDTKFELPGQGERRARRSDVEEVDDLTGLYSGSRCAARSAFNLLLFGAPRKILR